ncbi:myoferlin-like isoform X6 [Bolinopsis microptera]|uniref:myoferlin-like isoform X6 n=1 Tax=Bolinopsis microptera TaxID=2820187 RepID=UPI00307A1FD8
MGMFGSDDEEKKEESGGGSDGDEKEDQIFGPTIKILVKKATNLKNVLKFGTIDPYAEVSFENYTKKTKVQDDTKNPEWNEELIFPRANSDSVKVQVKIFHQESLGKDKLLAYGTGNITGYTKSDWHDIEIKLIDSKKRATEGVVSLGVGGGGEKGGNADEEGGEEGEEEEDEDEEEELQADGTPVPGSKKKRKKKKKRGKPGMSTAVEEARAKIDFGSLSTKQETFQIRFVVHKARQLKGSIETPIVRMSLDSKLLRTQPRHGKAPKYNETVIFSVTKSEKDLLNLPIEIAVLDTSKEPPYNMIGLYNLDLTVAFTEKDKLLDYKWFAIIDPDEPQEGTTGYVNVSIQIIPPGASYKKLSKKSDTEIDVASNVFYPPGITLQPGQFTVKLYTGEDLPQMDSSTLASVKNFFSSGEKPEDLVDPFVQFEFAGSKIESSTQYGTFDPVWGQKLVIHGQFPSMAEKFVVRVKDSDDFGGDDLIATKLLKMSQISFSSTNSDLGFQPTFGPSYIPLYGAPREFTEFSGKYEDLNKGDEPGIAYRGRILMELGSNMGEPDPALKNKSNIPQNESDDVMSSLRRHKYHLFTSFDTGNMIREKDSQVEFEVSIGDYGNSLSMNGSTHPSTTQPCNAVYDGTHYYFMPWSSSKPAVIIHSEWEDVEFRVETYNTMMWTLEYMEEEVRKFQIIELARAKQSDLSTKCNEMIQNLISELTGLALPEPPENATKLDRNLHKLRLFQIGLVKNLEEETPEFVGINLDRLDDVVIDIDDETKLDQIEEEEEDDEAEGALIELSDDEDTSDLPMPASGSLKDEEDEENTNAVFFDCCLDELEAMQSGCLQKVAPEKKLSRVANVISKFKSLCFEPQISVPDVFIWIMSGTSRIGYTRIPIHEILYTENERGRGKNCGKTGSYFLKKPMKEKIGAHLSMNIWFGKFEHVASAFKTPSGSEVTVFAETYENEMSVCGSWTTKLLPRPKWSDSTGKYEITKDSFEPPEAWRFDGDWIIQVDKAISFDNERGLTVFRETVFQGQTRKPGAKWTASSTDTWWQDEKGDDSPPMDEIPCKEGWKWTTEWLLDIQRAVDSAGYEYTDEADMGSYGPVERNYHLARRRLWARVRERTGAETKVGWVKFEAKEDERDPEGWEYSKLFTTKFHLKEKTFDMVRRRRWNKKLVSEVPVPITFTVYKDLDDKDKDDAETFNIAPRIMTEYPANNVKKYQLRAYLYQARGLLGADATGYSDPYARIVFGNRSGVTKVIKQSCSPMWDTTIMLDNIEICGDKADIARNPPNVVIEVFDEDALNHDKLGRVVCTPTMINAPYQLESGTHLQWYSIAGVKKSKGELLAAFELYEIGGSELPPLPRMEGNTKFVVPDNIRPKLARTRVEFLTWGLRELEDFKLSAVDSPHLEIEVGGEVLTMEKIKSVKKHANFKNPQNYIDVMLPVNELYLPPINIRVLDNRNFGYTPLIGVCSIKEYGQYRTTFQALMELAEHMETLKRNAGKEMNLEDPTTASTTDLSASITEIDCSVPTVESGEVKEVSVEVVQPGQVDAVVLEVGDPEPAGEKKATLMTKSQSTEQLIDNDELAGIADDELDRGIPMVVIRNPNSNAPQPSADKTPVETPAVKPAEEASKPTTRKEIRQQNKEEETKAANPDDVLVSDWWSKYYECVGNDPRLKRIFKERDLPRIKLYEKELEKVFNFNDVMQNIPIVKPDNDISDDDSSSDEEDEDKESRHRVGFFKGSLKIYEITEEMYKSVQVEKKPPKLLFSNLPSNQSMDVLIRVYVAAAVGLTPLDFGGSVDPYLLVKCGKTTISDKDKYLTKDVNPIFGRMFQIRAKLPRDSKLSIKVYDHDLIGANDLIGSTTVDVEDRYMSWRRASCGVSQQYIKTRTSKDRWRDNLKPVDLLKRMCLLKGWTSPQFRRDSNGLKVIVGGETYQLEKKKLGPMKLNGTSEAAEPAPVKLPASERNELAIQVLHQSGVTPEHIETRTLYNDDCPGIPQGKLHMWIDLFPYNESIPAPIAINPREPQKYILRCIIYNTEDVILDETNILGESMSDIYVRTYLEGKKKDKQETDTHYRSLTGEGNFNWRMVYPLDFIIQENKMIQKKKGKFWHIEKTVMKVDPILHLEVFDKDVLSRDDKLGWAQIDLTRIPAPTKTAKECSLDVYENEKAHPRMSLFEKKKIQGFWPVYDDSLGTRELTGKVEMELEILTEEEVAERPAGKARDDPNSNPTLEPPNRPETSFNWFTNPWKVFKILIWGRFKWHIIIGLLIILLVLFVVLMAYTAPEAINNAIYGR